MTDEQLDELERKAEYVLKWHADGVAPCSASVLLALIAEVREGRLDKLAREPEQMPDDAALRARRET